MKTIITTITTFIVTFSLFLIACTASDESIIQISNVRLNNDKIDQKRKVYRSNFKVTKDIIGEPVVSGLIEQFESIFGKEISIKSLHLVLPDKKVEKILQKADLKVTSDKELKKTEIKEQHIYFIFRGEAQLAGVKWVAIEDKLALVVFSSKNGKAYIDEIRSEDISQNFLRQFLGKGGDDKIKLGEDIESAGLELTFAKELTDAIRLSLWTMQINYNSE